MSRIASILVLFTASLTGTLFSQATPKLAAFASLLANPKPYLGQTIALHGIYLLTGANNILTVLQLTNLSAAVANPSIANYVPIGPPTSFATSVNGFVVDPLNTSHLFASTDQGVYASLDGGTTWALFGTGLPDVEVFDLKLQSPSRILRAATHGLGVFEISISGL